VSPFGTKPTVSATSKLVFKRAGLDLDLSDGYRERIKPKAAPVIERMIIAQQ